MWYFTRADGGGAPTIMLPKRRANSSFKQATTLGDGSGESIGQHECSTHWHACVATSASDPATGAIGIFNRRRRRLARRPRVDATLEESHPQQGARVRGASTAAPCSLSWSKRCAFRTRLIGCQMP